MAQTHPDLAARRLNWQTLVAKCRSARCSASSSYKKIQQQMLAKQIPPGSSVLHVGCGTGDLLPVLGAKKAVGIETSFPMYTFTRKRNPDFKIIESHLDAFRVDEQFDYIIADDVLLDCFDVDEFLRCIKNASHEKTRIIISHYSQLWRPVLKLLRFLRLARPRFGSTWFSPEDLRAALARNGFEIISTNPEVLLPLDLPLLSDIANRFFARLPIFRIFCLHNIFIVRPKEMAGDTLLSVSVIVPAKNEAGNISRLMKEIPDMGSGTEVIFVEGNSADDTYAVLEKAVREKRNSRVKLIRQPGKGKGDAVRAGFAKASGDILMILDADLTVPAESLPLFYSVVASGHADFANGTRLVYGMDDRAMQFLNLLANHFFAKAFTYLLGQPIRDTLCGTKVFRRELYNKIVANRDYFGDFDPFGDFDLLFGAARLHAKIANVPVRYRERVYGTTNISRFRHGILLFQMLFVAATKLKFY